MSKDWPSFAALDFETADHKRDSACSLGIVVVRDGLVSQRLHALIRPPRKRFVPWFVDLHGITWEMCRDKKTFAELWPELSPVLADVDFVAAHNAAFDRSVLNACCTSAGLPQPELRFYCSVRVGKALWGLPHNALPDLCRHLGIPLDRHHDALADAEACAGIIQAALREGWRP